MNTYSQDLRIGALVCSADGDELGRVKQLDGMCFKIDMPLATDWWLSTDAIDKTVNGVIMLKLKREALEKAKDDAGIDHKGPHLHSGWSD